MYEKAMFAENLKKKYTVLSADRTERVFATSA